MSPTPLQEALRAEPKQTAQAQASADYRGSNTAARFADPQAEFAALQSGCGIYDLGFRVRTSPSGTRFMLSC
jgi:hypothetical protein